MSIASIMKTKGFYVVSVTPAASVATISAKLTYHNIGAVLVMDGDLLVGIVSERDVVRHLSGYGAAALDMVAEDIMTEVVQTIALGASACEAVKLMHNGRFRHLPIMNDKQVIGIISIGDVVKARLDEQDGEVESLTAYVHGN